MDPALGIINIVWKIEKIYNESTEFSLHEGQSLIVQAAGQVANPIVDATCPIGKDWIVHLSIVIQEGPKNV